MELALTAEQRERVLAMRTAHLALIDDQASGARSQLPIYVGLCALGCMGALAGMWMGGLGWLFALLGALFAALFGWISWVLYDDWRHAPERAREDVARVSSDLSAGVAYRETFAVDEPWAFIEADDDGQVDASGPCVAFGVPSAGRIFLHDPEAPLPEAVHVWTLPNSRWRWTEEEGGPVAASTHAAAHLSLWGSEPVLEISWTEDEGPDWHTARPPD